MGMHAALMRLRLAELQPEEGDGRDEPLAFLRAQGIVKPEAWAEMLAPGLSLSRLSTRSRS
jgi:hypothetical protein